MDGRIRWAREQIETHLDQRLTIQWLADNVQLSQSRFAHLFREQVGVSPARYLHRVRMDRARLLLERTSLTVKQVMHQVGCHDPSHFARDFRRHHGFAPREWRAALGGRREPYRSDAADRPRRAPEGESAPEAGAKTEPTRVP